MKWRNKSLSYWLRVLHRDLGYLMVGVCLIYAVSGILLNHMNGKDPAFRTTEAAVQLEKGMQAEELLAAWNRQEDLPSVKRVLSIDESHHRLMLEGGVGVSTVDTSTPPSRTVPSAGSQKRAASLAAVDLPPPDGPTSAVTCPCFAVKETSLSTSSFSR